MLSTLVHVDLPSVETNRRMGPIEWVRHLFGARLDLRSGRELLTISALSLVEGLVQALGAAGITDVISLLVDRKVVYADVDEVAGDLPLLLKAAEDSGLLDRPFRQMHLVLSHREAGLHVLVDIDILAEVVLGGEEMTVRLSGRLESLRVEPGESAAAYAERVRAIAAAPGGLDGARAAFDGIAARVADALRRSLVGAQVRSEPSRAQVLRPEPSQIAHFRQLPFGDGVATPRYRAVPTTQRSGYYDSPFHYYYYDPYHDLTNWLLFDAITHGHGFQQPWVSLVDPGGRVVADGSDPSALQGAANGWAGAGAVSWDDAGGLCIDDGIAPVSSGPAAAEAFLSGQDAGAVASGAGPDSSSGAGDGGWGSSDAGSTSDSSSSGWGSSSCGSSCSSSSSSSCSSSSSSCSSSSSSCSSSSSSCSSS